MTRSETSMTTKNVHAALTFDYDWSLMGSECEPYWRRIGDQ